MRVIEDTDGAGASIQIDGPGTIGLLRGDGLRVIVRHSRPLMFAGQFSGRLATREELKHARDRAFPFDFGGEWSPVGGVTVVALADEEEGTSAIGVAVCSTDDNFCRATGLRIALSRAIFARALGLRGDATVCAPALHGVDVAEWVAGYDEAPREAVTV